MREHLPTAKYDGSPGRLSGVGVCRLGALPMSQTSALRADGVYETAIRRLDALVRARVLADEITDDLYGVIGSTADRRVRRALLRCRRAIHSLEVPEEEVWGSAALGLPASVKEKLAELGSLLTRSRAASDELERVYDEGILTTRRALQQAVATPAFVNGLLLSSASMSRARARYGVQGLKKLSGREERAERGLLRYLTRTTAKATPFSTLCTVIPARISSEDDGGHAHVSLSGDVSANRSFIRLNKAIYGALVGHLKKRATVRRHLPVELNPTLSRHGDWLRFLASIEGREVFQRVEVNPALKRVLDSLWGLAAQPFERVVAHVLDVPEIEAGREEVEEYLNGLLQIGLLRFRIGIREQEVDWDIPLQELLEGIEDDHARSVVAFLVELRALRAGYASAEPDARGALRRKIDDACRTTFDELGAAGLSARTLGIYEDATADAEATISRDFARTVEDRLKQWTSWTTRIAWPRMEQATMRRFFDSHYGSTVECIPLLDFYRDFYREHFKGHLEKEWQAERGMREEVGRYDFANPLSVPLVAKLGAANAALTALVRSVWRESPDAIQVVLSAEDVQRCVEHVPVAPEPARSLTVFATPIRPDETFPKGAVVVSRGMHGAGYGRSFSRFLYMFPDAVRARLFADNEALTPFRVAEICGDAQFNANLHPRLLRWEISYPTGESGHTEEQLAIGDLQVSRHADDPDALQLMLSSTGERVIPVDLGLLNLRYRPALYQLLVRFTPGFAFGLTLPETMDGTEGGAGEEDVHLSIRYRPRVVFEDAIVLSRRCWFVPAAAFPTRATEESAVEHFERVTKWHREHGIPDEVYVRIRPFRPPRPKEPQASEGEVSEGEPSAQEAASDFQARPTDEAFDEADDVDTEEEAPQFEVTPAGRETTPSRDYAKPQYIDFRSPLLVQLFGSLPGPLTAFEATFEERLPGAGSLVEQEGESFSAELILQLNLRSER